MPPAASDPGKGLGITGMIMGIVSLLCNTILACVYGSTLGYPLSVVGLILSIIAMKKSKAASCSNSMATAGFAMNLVGVIMFALSLLAGLVIGGLYLGLFALAGIEAMG